MWTLLSAGDSVVIDRILYGNTFAFFTKGLTRFGVNVRLADFTDPDAPAQALAADDKTKLVYFETPANPNLRVIDIARVSSLAKPAGALSIVENTFATPILQNPLKLGADLVIHLATKYLGGHGDLLGGAVVGPSAPIEQIRGAGLRALTGATLSAAQRLFDPTRPEDAGSAHGAAFALRSAHRRVHRASPARVACCLSRPQSAPFVRRA